MTVLRFGGGDVIEVRLTLAQVRELLEQALAAGALLELEGSNGEKIVINPQQVHFLQEAEAVERFPADNPVAA